MIRNSKKTDGVSQKLLISYTESSDVSFDTAKYDYVCNIPIYSSADDISKDTIEQSLNYISEYIYDIDSPEKLIDKEIDEIDKILNINKYLRKSQGLDDDWIVCLQRLVATAYSKSDEHLDNWHIDNIDLTGELKKPIRFRCNEIESCTFTITVELIPEFVR